MKPNDFFIVREATLEDIGSIVSVQVQAWKESYKGIIEQSFLDAKAYSEEGVNRRKAYFKTNESLACFVALVEDKVIGFVDVGRSREPSFGKGEIYAIYVLDDYKREGVGKALWSLAVEYLRHQKLEPFIVWVLKDNIPARTFYEGLGGILVGTKNSDIGGKFYPEVRYLFNGILWHGS